MMDLLPPRTQRITPDFRPAQQRVLLPAGAFHRSVSEDIGDIPFDPKQAILPAHAQGNADIVRTASASTDQSLEEARRDVVLCHSNAQPQDQELAHCEYQNKNTQKSTPETNLLTEQERVEKMQKLEGSVHFGGTSVASEADKARSDINQPPKLGPVNSLQNNHIDGNTDTSHETILPSNRQKDLTKPHISCILSTDDVAPYPYYLELRLQLSAWKL